MKYDDLDKLNDLKAKGALTEAEFAAEKAKILQDDGAGAKTAKTYWGMEEKTYAMLLHLSQLSSFLIPFAGLIMPIVMWCAYKNENAYIDQNGRHAVNWLISYIIYAIICVPLCFVIVGIPLLLTLFILDIVFCIMAGIKASDGVTWKYPMSIRFV